MVKAVLFPACLTPADLTPASLAPTAAPTALPLAEAACASGGVLMAPAWPPPAAEAFAQNTTDTTAAERAAPWIKDWARGLDEAPRPAPAWLPPATRIYAIGDVHGHATRLLALQSRIMAHAEACPAPSMAVVYLGDAVDRGPDSAAVVASMQTALPGLHTVPLRGNHEAMLMAAARNEPGARGIWELNGGLATLASFGARSADELTHGLLQTLARWHHAWCVGGYCFVHAGLRPGVPLEQQRGDDMLWIREPFLSWRDPSQAAPALGTARSEGWRPGHWVAVHGHTPAEEPQIHPHRIGIDTGAFMGGPLTCAVLQGNEVGFLRS